MRLSWPRGRLGGGLALLLLCPVAVTAQVRDSLQVSGIPPAETDTLGDPLPDEGRISPGGAFLRSAIVPGWGHAKVEAYGRGAFYFAVESAVAFMVFKTQSRLKIASDQRDLWESVVAARLTASGVEDPGELEELLAGDERLTELRGLAEVRAEQREDWIALGIFFLFLGGADAFVSAHLADFPEPLEVGVVGSPTGRVEVSLSVPVGF